MLAEYRETQNALSLEDRQNLIVARLNQVNDAVARARTARIQKEALYNQVLDSKNLDSIAAVAANPVSVLADPADCSIQFDPVGK